MAIRTADARWSGGLKDGQGTMALGSGAYEGPFSFRSRFEEGDGTNPEELIAAAHAGCFSMAFSATLEGAGHKPERVQTTAKVSLNPAEGGFAINHIALSTEASVPGISADEFQKLAETAKATCPVSKALAGVGNISLDARLV